MDYIEQIELLTSHICRSNIIYTEYAKMKGITYNRLMVYYALNLYAPCSQKSIVKNWGISKQTLNTIIKDMVNKGLINLEAGKNKKEKSIHLTKHGETEIKNIIAELMDIESESMMIFSDDEIITTIKNIGRMTDRFEIILKEWIKEKEE